MPAVSANTKASIVGLRPGAPQAADQRRGQQHIAEPAQRDDQDARPRGKRDAARSLRGAAFRRALA